MNSKVLEYKVKTKQQLKLEKELRKNNYNIVYISENHLNDFSVFGKYKQFFVECLETGFNVSFPYKSAGPMLTSGHELATQVEEVLVIIRKYDLGIDHGWVHIGRAEGLFDPSEFNMDNHLVDKVGLFANMTAVLEYKQYLYDHFRFWEDESINYYDIFVDTANNQFVLIYDTGDIDQFDVPNDLMTFIEEQIDYWYLKSKVIESWGEAYFGNVDYKF